MTSKRGKKQEPKVIEATQESPQSGDSEALAAFEKALEESRAWLYVGPRYNVTVPCDLPGYGFLQVQFKTGNRGGVTRLFDLMPARRRGILIWRILPLFVRGVQVSEDSEEQPPAGVREKLASLNFDEPATFLQLSTFDYDLVGWMAGTGYGQAKAIATAQGQ